MIYLFNFYYNFESIRTHIEQICSMKNKTKITINFVKKQFDIKIIIKIIFKKNKQNIFF